MLEYNMLVVVLELGEKTRLTSVLEEVLLSCSTSPIVLHSLEGISPYLKDSVTAFVHAASIQKLPDPHILKHWDCVVYGESDNPEYLHASFLVNAKALLTWPFTPQKLIPFLKPTAPHPAKKTSLYVWSPDPEITPFLREALDHYLAQQGLLDRTSGIRGLPIPNGPIDDTTLLILGIPLNEKMLKDLDQSLKNTVSPNTLWIGFYDPNSPITKQQAEARLTIRFTKMFPPLERKNGAITPPMTHPLIWQKCQELGQLVANSCK